MCYGRGSALFLPAESWGGRVVISPPALRVLGKQEAGFYPAVLGTRRRSASLEFLLFKPGVIQGLNQFGLGSMTGEKKVTHL